MNTNQKTYCDCGLGFKRERYYKNHVNNCDKNRNYLNQFIKKSFDDIEYIDNIPKVVFVCWFGIKNNKFPKMSPRRFNAFESLVKNIEVPVILITNENYTYFIKKSHPLHPAFEYLTGVHKSDYMRSYLLMHYGGGYHDVKFRKESWKDCWVKDDWLKNENIWMYGRREKCESNIACPPNMENKENIKKEYAKLVTMGWIICKPQTPFIKELVTQIETILTKHQNKLEKNPPIDPRQTNGGSENNYPIRWLEILGEISHPLMLTYNDHIKFGLPDALKKTYK